MNIRVLKPEDRLELRRQEPLHPDLDRLVKSMRNLLKRRYPNDEERQIVVSKIKQEMVVQ